MRIIKWIIIGIFTLGVIIIGAGLMSGGSASSIFNFSSSDAAYGELLTYEFEQMPNEVKLDLTTRHIIVHLVDDDKITLTYHAHEKDTWTFVDDSDGISIRQREGMQLLFFSFNFTSRKVNEVHLYLPDHLVYQLNLKSTTGSITMAFEQEQTFKNVQVMVTTGKINLSHMVIEENLDVVSTTGEILINQVKANTLNLEATTGDIDVKDSLIETDAVLKTSTGTIKLFKFIASSYDLKATTGSITASFESTDHLYFDLKTTTGRIRHLGVNQGNTFNILESATRTVQFKGRVTTGDLIINEVS